MKTVLKLADLFCGAGGTSLGALQAALALGYEPQVTATTFIARHTPFLPCH